MLLLVFSASSASAQISVGRVISVFRANERFFQDIIVSNSGPDPIHVVAQLEKVKERTPDDTEVMEESTDILVSPKRFSVPANGNRTARMMLKKPSVDTEQVYRLSFKPDQSRLDETESGIKLQPDKQAVIKVFTTIGMLIFVEPREVNANFSWTRTGGKVTFRNDGNIHEKLSQLVSCATEEDAKIKSWEERNEKCVKLGDKRVYPGFTHEVEVPENRWVTFRRKSGESGDDNDVVLRPVEKGNELQ